MTIEINLLSNTPYWESPQGIVGWLGWIAYLGLLVYLAWRWRTYNRRWGRLQWQMLIGLLLLVPLTSLLLALRLPAEGALPLPDRPIEFTGPAAIIFFGLPWMLAAGLLGVTPAAGLALLSGLLVSLFETHNPFTLLTTGLWGIVLGASFHQRYRTIGYRLLRRPLAGAVLLTLIYPILFVIESLLIAGGSLAVRMDYAFSWMLPAWGAVAIELLVAGVLVEIVSRSWPRFWGSSGALQPSPIERRLQWRFFAGLIPLLVILLAALLVATWTVTGKAAQQMIRDRMDNTAEVAAAMIPNYLETGQNLMLRIASSSIWYEGTPEQLSQQLSNSLNLAPYFNELYLLDLTGQPIDGSPVKNYLLASPTPEEYFGISLALEGVPYQVYTIAPASNDPSWRLSFFATIFDSSNQIRGILIARTDLAKNPLMQPAISSLLSLADLGGEGMLIDGEGQIVYRTDQDADQETFTGQLGEEALFYEGVGPDGTRNFYFTSPVEGSSWAVAASVPARQAQSITLTTAAPMLVILLVAFLATGIFLRSLLSTMIASLSGLALEANRLSSGQLDRPLQLEREDEIGQLSRAFETMRSSLKARLDEHNRLVIVSQGIAASLEFEEGVRPILDAALSTGASSARVVLSPDAIPEEQSSTAPLTRFGAGKAGEMYAGLDDQLLNLARQQERVALTNLPRVRLLNIPAGSARPESILALPLRHENLYFGALWLAYDTPHKFTDDEMRFITTLANQAAMALSNSRLFARAEVGRQRLASILDSTPDPVLVTDQRERLLLSNPAAWHVLGLGVEAGQGKPIDQVLANDELVRMLRTRTDERISAEVTLTDGRVYLAMASSVSVDGYPIGRICILRDITHFKELDAMKSEFVSTVSHDLRSPLTLMRGYATMLEMVGDLNEQQTSYVRKIVTSVESMSRLVNTLLDLGRIEAGVDLQLEMISVHEIVERVISSLQLQASQKQIVITTEIDPQAAQTIEADQALLHQALHNLTDNAIKYTEPGGQVFFRVVPDQGRVIFEITDTGIGIAPVDLPRLFEKFYRGGQREAKKRQGIGLGLAIVKSIAQRHRGEVWAESQLGKGSKFYIAIPVHQGERDRRS